MTDTKQQRVVVVGASPKAKRYSNRAVRLLLQHGHEVVPVNPGVSMIEDLKVIPRVADVTGHVDVLTLYVTAQISSSLEDDIIQMNPGRIIFNPGTENPDLRTALEAKGIQTEEACTLVLLNTNQF